MLKELLGEFIHHQDQYPEFDADTLVMDNYRLKPGLYLRLTKNGTIDQELYIGKKSEVSEDDVMVQWFKQADFLSALIEMNKAVDYPKKKIHSNNMFSLFCKLDTFWQEGIQPQLREHIDRYFQRLLVIKDKKSAEILAAAGYSPLTKENVAESQAIFLAALEAVAERIQAHNIKDNCYIKLFINENRDVYAYESGRYLLPRIFNCNDYNVVVNKQVLGLSNTDMGMNSKKPYLEHKTTEYKVPYRIGLEEALQLRKLYIWLAGQQTVEGKALYSGYIPIGEHDVQLFVQASEVNTRKAAIYIHLDRGKQLTVDDYDYLPYFNDRMDKPITFVNYLDISHYQGRKMNKLSEVEAHLNEYLYAFQLTRNYDVDKIQVSNKLSQALAVQIMQTRGAIKAWLRKGDALPLQGCVDKLTKGVIMARLQCLEYASALAQMLNVRLSLLNYFCGEGNDVGSIIKERYTELKSKILNPELHKEVIGCESRTEFYLALGQLFYYYFSLSQAQKIQYDALWRVVATAKNTAKIKDEHNKYFQKYAYAIETKNSRFNKMLSLVTSYTPEKEETVDVDALLYGFAANNIIYYKNKEEA